MGKNLIASFFYILFFYTFFWGPSVFSAEIENKCLSYYRSATLSQKEATIRAQREKAATFHSSSKKVMLVTDAWSVSNQLVAGLEVTKRQMSLGEIRRSTFEDGQINGVVKTLANTTRSLEEFGHHVDVIHPDLFRSFSLPNQKSIKLSMITPKVYREIENRIKEFGPDHLHIATEGPLGWVVRRIAKKNGWKVTSSYHTQFPEYATEFTHGLVPTSLGYSILRRFHSASEKVLVTTPTMREMLQEQRFENTEIWSRGVDTQKFSRKNVKVELRNSSSALYQSLKDSFERAKAAKRAKDDVIHEYETYEAFLNDVLSDKIKFALYVGRVSMEKSIEDFLEQDTSSLPGKVVKLIVGPGPDKISAAKDPYLLKLQQKYPGTLFSGGKEGLELLEHYSLGNVFVFPSRTDTFGNVVIEAMAMEIPVVAYNVVGPGDIIINGLTGILVNKKTELLAAIEEAFSLNPSDARDGAKEFHPEIAFNQIITNFVRMRPDEPAK